MNICIMWKRGQKHHNMTIFVPKRAFPKRAFGAFRGQKRHGDSWSVASEALNSIPMYNY